jgi:GTPase SAR1 family protein
VSTEQGEELSKKISLSYIETSAKTGENINDAFKMLALQMIKRFVFTEEV